MAGRNRSHSEERWALLPETIVRCNGTRPNGGRCKREAEDGAVVCDQHGGAAPQVRRRAAERLIMSADQAAAEAGQEAGRHRGAVRRPREDRPRSPRPRGSDRDAGPPDHPDDGGPGHAVLRGGFSDPSNWEENPPQPAIEERVIDRPTVEPEEIVEAEIVEPEGEPANDTPPRVAEMIKSGAFDRKPGQ